MFSNRICVIGLIIICYIFGTSPIMADEFDQADQYLKQGKLNKANWIYYSSLHKGVRVNEAHLGLAKSKQHARHYEGALEHINSYLQSNPDSRMALQLRSELYIQLQQWANAASDLEQLRPIDDEPGLYMLLNIAYENLGQSELAKQAKDAYQQVTEGSSN